MAAPSRWGRSLTSLEPESRSELDLHPSQLAVFNGFSSGGPARESVMDSTIAHERCYRDICFTTLRYATALWSPPWGVPTYAVQRALPASTYGVERMLPV